METEIKVKVPTRDYTIRQIRAIVSLVRGLFDELGLESPSIVVREENPYYTLELGGNYHSVRAVYSVLSRISRDIVCSECGGEHYESDCPHVQITVSELVVNQSNDWYKV